MKKNVSTVSNVSHKNSLAVNSFDEEEYEFLEVDFGDIQEGDEVQTPSGEWSEVIQAHEEHIPEQMFEVETDSGSKVLASGNHLWYVETSLDKQLHKSRVKESKKVFQKVLSEMIVQDLNNLAEYSEDDVLEISLADVVALVWNKEKFFADDREEKLYFQVVKILTRIAESIGHIAEENTQLAHLDSYDYEGNITVGSAKLFDAKLFAQQILALYDSKKYDKWSVVVGRVVSTVEMAELQEFFDVNIPDPN